MFIPFSRVVVLAVLYLSVLTTSVPVQGGTELSIGSGLVEADHDGHAVELDARARTTAKPKPRKTTVRKPVPPKTTIRKPVPTTKRPTPAKPTTPVKRPTPVPKPPVKPSKPATPAKPPVKPTPKPTPKPTKPTKPPVKTTPKPTPKPTKTPAKPTKPTKTTSKTPKPTPSKAPQCPVKKPTKGTKGPRALFDWAVGLFKRDNAEFIGWHGTNSNTAELWRQQGYLANPKTAGWPWSSGGTSGADHELGPGVYITDEMDTARGFANTNAQNNPGTEPMLCAIFARSELYWKNSINKVWLPTSIIRDSSDAKQSKTYEKQRREWIKTIIPQSSGKDVARFAPLDKRRGGPPNQVAIPSALTANFYAVCVPAHSGQIPLGATTYIDYGVERYPWNVRDKPCK
ncbi:hypothetical protein AURDEDRAFT_111851 [Auricularia subglabra TFB-10046 SS5]|nr:hypothetical protein AURDEDRAFT_111851 [Auricularia subglabra TFB-10046 SS5]